MNQNPEDNGQEENVQPDAEQKASPEMPDERSEPETVQAPLERQAQDEEVTAQDDALAQAMEVLGLDALDADELRAEAAKHFNEANKLKDAYLRAKAEEENVRRRSEREVNNSRKFAVEGFAKELLTVRDSLSLAAKVELTETDTDALTSMKEGVDMTLKQFDSALAKFSIKPVAAEAGDALDPNLHQAMSIIEVEGVDSGCLVDVIQTGFTLHDRLLRPALVVVAK